MYTIVLLSRKIKLFVCFCLFVCYAYLNSWPSGDRSAYPAVVSNRILVGRLNVSLSLDCLGISININ